MITRILLILLFVVSCKQIPINNSGKTLVEKSVNLESSSILVCVDNKTEFVCKRTQSDYFYIISREEWDFKGLEFEFDRVLRKDLIALLERIKFFCQHRQRDCTEIKIEADKFKQFLIKVDKE